MLCKVLRMEDVHAKKDHAVENHVRRGISVFLFLVAAATTDCKTAVIAHLCEF